MGVEAAGLTPMKLTVTRHDQGKYETVITRDDGVSYRLKGVAHTFTSMAAENPRLPNGRRYC